MEPRRKLQIPPGTSLFMVNAPEGFKLDVPAAKSPLSAAVMVFASNSTALGEHCGPAVDAAKEGRLSWIASPRRAILEPTLIETSYRSIWRGMESMQ